MATGPGAAAEHGDVGATTGDRASRRPDLRFLVAADAGVIVGVLGVGWSSVPQLAWPILVAALAATGWATVFALPAGRRVLGGVVHAGAAMVALAWLLSSTPTGIVAATFGCFGLSAFLICGLAAMISGDRSSTGRWMGAAATIALAAPALVWGDQASVRVRFLLNAPTEEAEALLARPLSGRFPGQRPGPQVGTGSGEPAPLPPVVEISGYPVAWGEVVREPPTVRYCLVTEVDRDCTAGFVYSPATSLDGRTAAWNVDCDLVTRQVTGHWYRIAMECPRS